MCQTESQGRPKDERPSPSTQWTQSKQAANELAILDLLFWSFAGRHFGQDGRNLALWPFGLHPASPTSRPLGFLFVYPARTIIREGKVHCCILTIPRPRAQTQLGALRLAPARLPGQTGQCLPPASLLALPSQPGHNAQAYSGGCVLHHTHPVLSGPVICNPRPAQLAPDWTHFAATLLSMVLVYIYFCSTCITQSCNEYAVILLITKI